MRATADTLAGRLESALGSQAVRHDQRVLQEHAVDGFVPAVAVTPQDAVQIGEVLKICSEAGAAVVPWGGGTAMRLGNVPARVDVALSLERLNVLREHDDANLTATVQAGMRLGTLQERLAPRRQFLALDPPRPDTATAGGIVAANLNGPRRMLYGGVRDQLIGIKAVLANGEEIKAGGKVVKNVAGYDMCKLFTGSLGTLGVISEVTFRMAPIPERSATVLASGTHAQVWNMVARIHESVLLPAGVAVMNAAAAGLMTGSGVRGQGPGDWNKLITVWVEGFNEAVDRHLSDLQSMARGEGMSPELLHDTAHDALWNGIRDFGSRSEGTLFRLVVPLSAVGETSGVIEGWFEAAQIVAHAGSGMIWMLTDADDALDGFARLTELAAARRGHTIIAAAPSLLKSRLDVWGPSPPGYAIMQDIKRQFDPAGVLNPGRFVGRL